MELITKITVDLIKPNSFTIVYAKQKDVGRGIEATLTANGIIFVLEDSDTVNIYVTKPDGHICYNPCEISNGKAIVPLTAQSLAVAGKAKCEIEVIRGTNRLSNPIFTLNVQLSNIDESAVLSEDELGVVASLKEEIAVERARIDAIGRLKEGSTTGDAELQDIRIGHDGTEYPSAGAAVRGQIGQLFDLIENMEGGSFVSTYSGEVEVV